MEESEGIMKGDGSGSAGLEFQAVRRWGGGARVFSAVVVVISIASSAWTSERASCSGASELAGKREVANCWNSSASEKLWVDWACWVAAAGIVG